MAGENITFGRKQAEAIKEAINIAIPEIEKRIRKIEPGSGDLLYWVGVEHRLLEINRKIERMLKGD